jgi:hypothetical protein
MRESPLPFVGEVAALRRVRGIFQCSLISEHFSFSVISYVIEEILSSPYGLLRMTWFFMFFCLNTKNCQPSESWLLITEHFSPPRNPCHPETPSNTRGTQDLEMFKGDPEFLSLCERSQDEKFIIIIQRGIIPRSPGVVYGWLTTFQWDGLFSPTHQSPQPFL